MRRLLLAAVAALALAAPAQAGEADVRFATFNASLNRSAEGLLVQHLSTPDAGTVFQAQARNVAEVIQRVRPDVLLVNEFDFDAGGRSAELFRDNYLAVSQNGQDPLDYPYVYTA
ncbi:MAG TPA: endonuclease/exonuclease/phosphatase family protein, partial [Longimicrobium sp.]|nr:endonuclease/exonuclease/phosphatase family protein [Longimicrobium sp.]